MKLTRRKLFATLLAPLVCRVVPQRILVWKPRSVGLTEYTRNSMSPGALRIAIEMAKVPMIPFHVTHKAYIDQLRRGDWKTGAQVQWGSNVIVPGPRFGFKLAPPKEGL